MNQAQRNILLKRKKKLEKEKKRNNWQPISLTLVVVFALILKEWLWLTIGIILFVGIMIRTFVGGDGNLHKELAEIDYKLASKPRKRRKKSIKKK